MINFYKPYYNKPYNNNFISGGIPTQKKRPIMEGGYNKEWFDRKREEARIEAEQKKYWDRIRHKNKMKRLKEERKRKDDEGAKKTMEAVKKRKEERAKALAKMNDYIIKNIRFTSDAPTEGSGKKTVSERIFEKMHIKKIKPIKPIKKSIKRGKDILKSYGIK